MDPLDRPLEVRRTDDGKYAWPARYWSFLNVFGSFLNNAGLDDPEVEAFEEGAVLLLTFHQAKGLEFDRVYVAGTGRDVDLAPALRTKLFSGEEPPFTAAPPGVLESTDPEVCLLAEADREREVYVALTRARQRLTILHDPEQDWAYLKLNPALERVFAGRPAVPHPRFGTLTVSEYVP
jgi:DNA helicase-2/ATP-dependent DNA helicase PcrA